MTRTQPESRIVSAILRRLNATPNTVARKTHGSRYSVGWPDIIGCTNGRMFAIEVKQPGKRATPRQVHELAKWRLAGALVGVATSVTEAVDIVWPMITATTKVVLACGTHGTITTPIERRDASDAIMRHRDAGCTDVIITNPEAPPSWI